MNELNQLTKQEDTHYTYDANGNLTSIHSPLGTKSFSYDGLDRLISVEENNQKNFLKTSA